MSMLDQIIKEEQGGAITIERYGIEATLTGVPSGVIVDLYEKHGQEEKGDDEFSIAMFDAMLLHSIKLHGLPDDETWLQELMLSVKLGITNLPDWLAGSDDLSELSGVEKGYLYKRYCYVTGSMIQQVGLMTEGVEKTVTEAIKRAASKVD